MNKMVINHLDKLIITSDAATITREVEVQHPAAKMIALAADMQEKEAGDGSNFVLTICGELMQQAENLIKEGLHPSDILIGYEKAAKKCLEILESLVAYTIEDIKNEEEVIKVMKGVVASKHYGNENILAPLVAKACVYAMPKGSGDSNVRPCKILGGSLADSEVVHGLALLRPSETSVHHVKEAKIAVYNCEMQADSGDTKGTVVFKTAEELINYTKGEEEAMEKFIKGIADSGVNVVFAAGTMSEIAVHYFEKYKIMTIKILSKFEIRRIAKAVGATLLVRHEAPTPDEMGSAQSVSTDEIASQKVTIIKRDDEANRLATIIIRGSTNTMLDDSERAIEDGVQTFKNTKDKRFVAGAGATELHIASQIQTFAKTQPGLDQYAVEKFGMAFEVIPRTLAENAGLNAEEIIAKLYSETAKSPFYGIDVEEGKIKDMKEMEIFDSLETKSWAIKLAVDAVLTILKVDQIIMSKPAGGPKPREATAPDLD
jgi:T-complex protein 1 subunit theta